MQSGRMPVPDRLLPRRLLVDRLQGQWHLDQLLAILRHRRSFLAGSLESRLQPPFFAAPEGGIPTTALLRTPCPFFGLDIANVAVGTWADAAVYEGGPPLSSNSRSL
jgi:hypothetical protein